MKKTLKGFTLIEMLIVIVIIGILAAVLLPKLGGARDKANDVAVKSNVRNIAQGALQLQLAGHSLPANFTGTDSDTALNTPDNADKYDFNYIKPEEQGKYSYALGKNNHFLICGELSSPDAGGNSLSGANGLNEDAVSAWKEGSEGQFFCYKG